MDDIQNSNPTVLPSSDLPSRRPASPTTHHPSRGTGLFDSLVPAYGYPYDPFLPKSPSASSDDEDDDEIPDPIDAQEIYDLISTITDPEHPLSLGSLSVVNLPDITIIPPSSPASRISTVQVLLTPTVTHCGLATVIGLGVRVRLERALPPRFRIDVRIKPGTHSTAEQVSRQLGDKERVAAAVENATLMAMLKKMLEGCD
ncbi:cytoplasmic protein-like protein required for cell viability [Trichodelitschia bisporula]|uniref:Cytoplasmic protein-like protein required for cell viability n=1 Tax=Trichodelitschia bisporula TaxID=703511 RepID=A0A6G1I4U2_9PEZI|nr:cytoplasmic protein-like protein required for cell viability [Trichodelitschia bisporula]